MKGNGALRQRNCTDRRNSAISGLADLPKPPNHDDGDTAVGYGGGAKFRGWTVRTIVKPFDLDIENKLYGELQSEGFTCLPDVIDPGFLQRCRDRVDELIALRGNRYFSIIQPQEHEGGPFAEMAETPGFVSMLRNLSRRSHSEASVENFELYNVLRVIAGPDAAKTAFQFHYDATVITALMPIFIPDGLPSKSGALVAMPNRRRYRSSSFVNIAEKAILQNPLAFRFYGARYGSGERNVFQLQPGSMYFFNGYRTFHGNIPCEPGAKRATLLFHFGNPHAGDAMTKAVLGIRKIREKRRLHAN